ncbi:GSCOCG00013490001-RA-CDS [Cotesia congregata]|nr:GSCOCG00013490001-RA-CDS [Cotesia congregata]
MTVRDKNILISVISKIGVICLILPIISARILGLTSPLGPINKCETDECKTERLETAALILKYRDDTTSPCDNIFQHVCGNYEKSDLTHNYDFIESTRTAFRDKMIGEEMEWVDKSTVYKLIHDFYTVCMDEKAGGEKAWETLKSAINSLGGWPAVESDQWKEADFNWIDFISNAKKLGFKSPFLHWVPKTDDEMTVLTFSLQMPSSHFEEGIDPDIPLHRQIYTDLMFKMGFDLGATDKKIDKDLDDAVEFEYALYNLTRYDTAVPLNMMMEELQKEYPSVDWSKFVEKTLTPYLDAGDKPVLSVDSPGRMKKFFDLMEKTPKRVQATYGVWKVIQSAIPLLRGAYPKIREEFRELLNQAEIPREAYCDEMTTNYADLAVARYYLDHFESSKETIGNMFSMIKGKIIEMLKESKKLSEDEKKQGVEIMEKMDYTIGSSKKLSDVKELEKYYEDAKLVTDNLLQSVLNMNIFKRMRNYSNKWRAEQFAPQKLASAGMPENFENHLYIPISMIPNLMFDNNLPMYLNFGAAGSMMAQAMFSSVAHLGKTFAEDGKVIPDDQYKCFMQMTDNFTDPMIREALLENALDEMLGLYIGFQAAYKAYHQYVAESGPELALPEVPYTVPQLFWVAWTQVLCYAKGEEIPLPKPFEGSDLNVMEYANMMMMANVPQISEDFKCPVGSLMNPQKKCTWW